MIGLYSQNKNTQNELCRLFQDIGLVPYQPAHQYALVIYLGDKAPTTDMPILLEKDLSLPMSLSEWRLLLQKHGASAVCYQNHFFKIETDRRLLTHLKTKQQISLTEKENDLLKFLIQSPNHTASRETLLQAVWQYNPEAETHTLESHLYTLKQKAGSDAENLLKFQDGHVVLI